jgi:phosphoglycolate phosphatase
MNAAQRLFVFTDLDGTLEDSRDDMTAAARRVRAAFGLPTWEDARLTPHVNRGMRELYLACFADFLEAEAAKGEEKETTLERIRVAYEADYLAHVADATTLYPGMGETLAGLAERGATLVVVTNKPERISRALLEAMGVMRFIADVMGGDSCPETKPSALPLRIAAERHGFVAGRDAAFMMGDTAADMACGKAFGARTIWCAYGYLATRPEPLPDFTADKPSDILALIVGS